jgi:hypothetical protein
MTDFNCAAAETGRGGRGCQDLYDEMTHARTLTVIGFAVTGILAASSILFFALSSSSSESAGNVTLKCGVAPSGRAICQGFF